MKKCLLTLLLALASPLCLLADTAVARPDVEELLTVMRVEKLLEGSMEQMKKSIPQMMSSMASQSNLSPADAQKSKAVQEEVFTLIQQAMSWKNMKGDLVKIYAESFTPEEIKGITAFYKSPAGQAFLDKQPVLMQKSMELNQKRMMELMPKIQAMIQAQAESK